MTIKELIEVIIVACLSYLYYLWYAFVFIEDDDKLL